MAYIERRRQRRRDGSQGPVRWRVRYEVTDAEGATRERSRTFDREDDARRFRRQVEGDLDAGMWIDPRRSRDTLAAWVPQWRASIVDLRATSLSRLDGTVNSHVLPRFGDLPLSGITNADVRAWVAELRADGLSPSSVRKAAFALRRILDAAVADRRLTANPADNVPLPADEPGEQRFLSPAEVASLADATPGRYRAVVLTACYAGLRFGELCALRRRRVDLMRGRVEVAETLADTGRAQTFGPPKTKRGRRTVPVPRVLGDALADHLECYVVPEPDALLFTTEAGQPLRRGSFRRDVWLPAVRAAGLDGLRFHDTRHTYVSLCAAAGLDLYEVSVRAGHSTAAFTADRYRHLFDDADDAYADALDAYLGEGSAPASAPVVSLTP